MIFLVYGGSGSGKSSFAEKLLSGFLTADKYYIATMALAEDDLEGQKKLPDTEICGPEKALRQ